MPTLLKIFIALASVYLLLLVIIQLASRSHGSAGIIDGALAPVTGKPNCVSSQADSTEYRVEPLAMKASEESTQAALLLALEELGGQVSIAQNYVHATFTSRIFRFKDDLECRIVPDEKIVHIRSASRLGYSDLGANRKRVEALRAAYGE